MGGDTPAGHPTVYQPGDPDPLRDGLLRGFWAHRARLEAGEVWPTQQKARNVKNMEARDE